jgi:GMP synthase-like glutamine amidotransferase
LTRSPTCAHQAFALRQHLGMQFHIEITPAKIGVDERRHRALPVTQQSQGRAHLQRLARALARLHLRRLIRARTQSGAHTANALNSKRR